MHRQDFLKTSGLLVAGAMLSPSAVVPSPLEEKVTHLISESSGFRADFTAKAKVDSDLLGWAFTRLGARSNIDGYVSFKHDNGEYEWKAEATNGRLLFVNLGDKSIFKKYATAHGAIGEKEFENLSSEGMTVRYKDTNDKTSSLEITNNFAKFDSSEGEFKEFYSYGEEVNDPVSALFRLFQPGQTKTVNFGTKSETPSVSEIKSVPYENDGYDVRIETEGQSLWGIEGDVLVGHSGTEYNGLEIPGKIYIEAYNGAEDKLSDINIRLTGYELLFD